MQRFDRFTERAQDVAMRAYEILKRYGDTPVDTEHLLLAFVEQPSGMIPEILQMLEADPHAIARQLDESLQRTERSKIYPPGVSLMYITPRLKRVIDLSHEEATRLRDDDIGAEHLFLAIANERNTIAARVLTKAGVSRQGILDALSEFPSTKAAPAEPHRYRLAGGVRIGTEEGDLPVLTLTQGTNQVRVAVQDVTALIGALAQAAGELTANQREQ